MSSSRYSSSSSMHGIVSWFIVDFFAVVVETTYPHSGLNWSYHSSYVPEFKRMGDCKWIAKIRINNILATWFHLFYFYLRSKFTCITVYHIFNSKPFYVTSVLPRKQDTDFNQIRCNGFIVRSMEAKKHRQLLFCTPKQCLVRHRLIRTIHFHCNMLRMKQWTRDQMSTISMWIWMLRMGKPNPWQTLKFIWQMLYCSSESSFWYDAIDNWVIFQKFT